MSRSSAFDDYPQPAVKGLVALLEDKDSNVQKKAVEVLSEVVKSMSEAGKDITVKALSAKLKHKDSKVRETAAEILLKIATEVFASSDYGNYRKKAVDLFNKLSKVYPAESLDGQMKLTKDDSVVVKACLADETKSEKVIETLVGDAHPLVRCRALERIDGFNAPDLEKIAVKKLVKDPDPFVKGLAIYDCACLCEKNPELLKELDAETVKAVQKEISAKKSGNVLHKVTGVLWMGDEEPAKNFPIALVVVKGKQKTLVTPEYLKKNSAETWNEWDKKEKGWRTNDWGYFVFRWMPKGEHDIFDARDDKVKKLWKKHGAARRR